MTMRLCRRRERERKKGSEEREGTMEEIFIQEYGTNCLKNSMLQTSTSNLDSMTYVLSSTRITS